MNSVCEKSKFSYYPEYLPVQKFNYLNESKSVKVGTTQKYGSIWAESAFGATGQIAKTGVLLQFNYSSSESPAIFKKSKNYL